MDSLEYPGDFVTSLVLGAVVGAVFLLIDAVFNRGKR